jgi:lysophospholipase L1-like esterase
MMGYEALKLKLLTFSLLIISLFLVALRVMDTQDYESSQASFERLTHAHYMRKVRNIDEESVVFIGSSSIQGLDVSQITQRGVNLGIGGETLAGLIYRMQDYSLIKDAKIVVIGAGFNDLCNSTLAQQKVWFNELLSLINDIPLVISSMQPAITPHLCVDFPKRIVQYNDFLLQTCNAHQSCNYVNLSNVIEPASNRAFESDGLHLNPLGYMLWSNELQDAINDHLMKNTQ